MVWLVIGLIAYVVYLDRRLGQFERRLDALEPVADPFAEFRAPAILGAREQPALAEEPAVVEEVPQVAAATVDESPTLEPSKESETQAKEPDVRARILNFDFEELFGRRLPIWAGGITLAIAGMLIVKLSIESGLLTPAVRVISGLAFGAVLIAAAEFALRQEARVRDPRVRQSLAGAGLASLYASILIATNAYGLIDPLAAMLGMAAVTGLALFLATRFGAPSALLGLAGGLAAPALIGSDEPNVPLLSLYLALAVGGLCTLSRNQRWAWLGISALVGGFGWGLLLLLGGVLDAPSSISLGLYLLLLGVGIPALGFAGDRRNQLQLIAAIVAAAQMAALVAMGGFALINWGLYALISLASLWLARRDPALERLPAVALLIALLLMGAWPTPFARDFALVLAGGFAVCGPPAWWRLWRAKGGLLEAAQIGALCLCGLILPMFHFYRADASLDAWFGLLGLSLALAAGSCAALGWRNPGRSGDARFVILSTVAAFLLSVAANLLLPAWSFSVAVAAIGFGLLHLGQAADGRRFEPVAWIFAAVGALVIPFTETLNGLSVPENLDALRWVSLSGIAGLFAWRDGNRAARSIAQFLAPLFLCGGLSLIVAERVEPLIAPALLLAAVWTGRRLANERLVPAMAAFAMLILVSATWPLLTWSSAAADSLVGIPMLIGAVPHQEAALLKLLIPGLFVGAAVALAYARLRPLERVIGLNLAAILATIGAHSLYKQVFAIGSPEAFVALGLAERMIWELLLVSAAAVALKFADRRVAIGLAIAAASHLTLYTLLLHNPLWNAQAVGAWPIVNLLLPVYALALGLAVTARQWLSSRPAQRVLGIVQMALITLFAFSTLRQLFHGSVLVGPELSSAEDIGRSILAIALAIGFLVWGITRRDRDWRLASLALMLAAVAKVFLFDASGLEGVTRIASFIALGLSLIGIGWIYARHLGVDRAPDAASA
ncbi:DUF2339 domain-containing protein [Sphingomonas sp.]|uniref:DUF2339 domain-containing protein n=1 Tax=Sphingomonas sp. TaxID=28214 RepID=UPI00286AF2BA|nr:DUF2339 domain-containing protein [Sphingomonas sp.]